MRASRVRPRTGASDLPLRLLRLGLFFRGLALGGVHDGVVHVLGLVQRLALRVEDAILSARLLLPAVTAGAQGQSEKYNQSAHRDVSAVARREAGMN